jgi:hypothetical protein
LISLNTFFIIYNFFKITKCVCHIGMATTLRSAALRQNAKCSVSRYLLMC